MKLQLNSMHKWFYKKYRLIYNHWIFCFTIITFLTLIALWIINPSSIVDWFFKDKPHAEILAYIGLCCGAILLLGNQHAANKRNLIMEKGQLDIRFKDAATLLSSNNTSAILSGIYALHQVAVEASKDHSQQGYVSVIANIFCAYIRENRSNFPNQEGNIQSKKIPAIIIQTIVDSLFFNKDKIYKDCHLDLSSSVLINIKWEKGKINFHNTDLTNTDFRSAKLEYANFTGARLTCTMFCHAELTGANFSNTSLASADFRNAVLINANLNNCNLMNANLKNAILINADLRNALLLSADLQSAELSGANLYHATFDNANLKYSSFEDAILSYANIVNANLKCTHLENANLENSDLTYSDLSNANLNYAKLNGATLDLVKMEKTHLYGVVLKLESLKTAEINDVYINKDTILYKDDISDYNRENLSKDFIYKDED